MAQVIAQHTVLSDSLQKTRPEFSSYLMPDSNAGGNSVSQIERKRLERQMKFPTLVGRQIADSFLTPQAPTDPAFRKYNDEGDHRVNAPFRSCDNFIDPVSGFVSVSGDIDRNTGHTKIASLVQLQHAPNTHTPKDIHSNRVNFQTAPPEIRRASENDPGSPYAWNSRKVIDASLRASLGGWTSDKDPRIAEEEKLRGSVPKTPKDDAKVLRDKLAMRYLYTSSQQRAYEELPWDTVLPSKRFPPTSTLEPKPDQISQRFTLKKYDARPEEWQTIGRSWDWFQNRQGYYKKNPMDIVFCSPCPRTQHIPLYSGAVGGRNIVEVDNAKEPFTPFTVKRVPIPRPTDTSHRPHIPGFAGSTLYRSATMPLTQAEIGKGLDSSTAISHRPMQVQANSSEFRRESHMSKMVTTVPPCNPFNKIERQEVKLIGGNGNSKDHKENSNGHGTN